jgi:hypothetical protein
VRKRLVDALVQVLKALRLLARGGRGDRTASRSLLTLRRNEPFRGGALIGPLAPAGSRRTLWVEYATPSLDAGRSRPRRLRRYQR